MPILFCALEIYLPHSHSLKEKRKVLRKTIHRLRSRFNFSISEIDHPDLWQRARIGAVSVGPDRRTLQRACQKFLRESAMILGSDLVRYDVEFFDHD